MDLKNLSVEELEKLRSEIDSLIEEKFTFKYNEDTCFINPKDLSFGYVLDTCYPNYAVSLNYFESSSLKHVPEPYLDNCIIISQDEYDELSNYGRHLTNKLYKFHEEKDKEIKTFKESLEKEFKNNIQEMVNNKK
jgi:hypothetical protein